MKLDQVAVQSRLALCAAALAGAASAASNADAAIITFTTPLTLPNAFSGAIPQTFAGVYINLTTGATGTSGGGVTGWDFNPYLASAGTQLGFYWAPTPAGNAGGVVSGTSYADLSGGGLVGPASTFSASILGTTGSPFITTGTHILGLSFFNEGTATRNFGYMTIQNVGPNTAAGFSSNILSWSFDDTGAAITVPAIPAPAAVAPLSMAALAFGARRVRPLRRQIAA